MQAAFLLHMGDILLERHLVSHRCRRQPTPNALDGF
jgi:hypothetical protein